MASQAKTGTNPSLQLFKVEADTMVSLPLAGESIAAGFPSPAQDYLEVSLDLNKELIDNPSSTFLGRVKGQSMVEAGIEDGDLLIIDKSLEPREGDTVVCFLDGEFTLKYYHREKDAIYLVPANPAFPSIRITETNHFCIWGVVTYSIRRHRPKRRRSNR
jgi:DNA polymerase V